MRDIRGGNGGISDGVGNALVAHTESDWGDFLPTCFHLGSGPEGGKVSKLCEFVLGTKVLPHCVPKLVTCW